METQRMAARFKARPIDEEAPSTDQWRREWRIRQLQKHYAASIPPVPGQQQQYKPVRSLTTGETWPNLAEAGAALGFSSQAVRNHCKSGTPIAGHIVAFFKPSTEASN